MKKKKFENDLIRATETGTLKMAGKKLTPFVMSEICAFYDCPAGFTTICKEVFETLTAYGVKMRPDGIGWRVV